jgi:hypothetical protein
MIGYNALGRNGRLGNQMFQYAGLKGIAANRGFKYTLPPQEFEPRPEHHLLFDVFNMPSVQHISFMPKDPGVSEGYFHFNEHLFNNCPDNVNLGGYFQTQKYFEHIAEDIKKDFTFKTKTQIKARTYLDNIKDRHGDNLLCLNVRRGDYLHYPDHHPLCTLDYYEEALSKFDKQMFVILVSDDKQWMAEQSLFKSNRFHITDTNLHFYVDMCIMSMIDYHIISNSTFSWWSAWLSNKKKVIAPLRWFGVANAHVDTKDLIPPEWERI